MIQNIPLDADYFGQRKYLRSKMDGVDINKFMIEIVAPALGISANTYDPQRDAAVSAFNSSFMTPTVEKGSCTFIYIHLSVQLF